MKRNKKNFGEKIVIGFIIVALVISSFAIFYTIKSLFFQKTHNFDAANTNDPSSVISGFTPFDIQLAKRFMDKNNDGKCDVCGMDVNICIESGQMQCNMDSKSTIGILGSQHIHADWKVYVNGKLLDFSDKAHMERMRVGLPVSSFIHVDSGSPAPEKTGDILHMHATGVPLWVFFDSINLELPNGMKVYVTGKEILDYKNYVFNDLDKILITNGQGDLQEQINSVTSFSQNH